jgi:hypothetical protein
MSSGFDPDCHAQIAAAATAIATAAKVVRH